MEHTPHSPAMDLITPVSTIVLTSVLTAVAALAVFTRVSQHCKTSGSRIARKDMNPDDWFCIVALFFSIPSAVIIIWGAAKGSMGANSSPADVKTWFETATPAWITMAQVFWVVFFLQPIVLGCVRLAILFFYRRIFVYKSFKIFNWILIGLVAGWTVAFSIGLFFDCGSNIAANWGSLGEIADQCSFGFLPTVIYTIIDACFDLFVLLLPLPWIRKLQIPLKKKLLIVGCFMMGGVATAAAFVRMAIFIQTGIPAASMNRTSVMGLPTYDVLGIVSAEVFWTMIETTVAIIAVCLPAIKKTLRVSINGKIQNLSSLGRYFHSTGSASRSRTSKSLSQTSESKSQMSESRDIEMANTGAPSDWASTASLVDDNHTHRDDKTVGLVFRVEDLDPRLNSRTGNCSLVEAECQKSVVEDTAIYRLDEVVVTRQ